MAKSVHARLLNIRNETGEEFNHLLVRYGLERLLYRVDQAGYADTFILKGAMLFSLWQDVPGRPTRDIDLLGLGDLSHKRLRAVFAEVCRVKVVEDGLCFDTDSIKIDDIREGQVYHGVRIRLVGFLDRARLPVQIDIGFGDAVTPPPATIRYPAILDFPSARLRAYHPATVVAEKLNAMVVLGTFNSRLKDFYDMHVILAHMDIDDAELERAIHSTFTKRKVPLPSEMPAAFTPEFLEDGMKEQQWQAFLRRSALTECKLSLAQILKSIQKRTLPLLGLA